MQSCPPVAPAAVLGIKIPKNEENSDNINRRTIKNLLASDYIETNVFTSLVVAAFTSPHLVGYDWAMVARRSDGVLAERRGL